LRELRVMECSLGTSLEVPKLSAGLTFKVSMHGTFVHAEGNSSNLRELTYSLHCPTGLTAVRVEEEKVSLVEPFQE